MTDRVTQWLESYLPQGALPPRARLASDAPVLSLNGTWEFRYAPGGLTGDRDDVRQGTVEVPGCWQTQGYGLPQYQSAQYPIPLDVPHVPDDNPTGEYRRRFDAPEAFREGAYLRFDGIDSTGWVWLNGVEVGWTRGSRLTHEFDVTGLLRAEGNELVVLVAQWSAGTYVEDQDMMWFSGIFRDVDLVARPRGGIEDVRVVADLDPAGHGLLTVTVQSAGEPSARLVLADGEVDVPADGAPHDVGQVLPWTAETPARYELRLTTATEAVTVQVGFRRVEIADGLLKVNGIPIRFRGVNRHDADPVTGRTVTREQIRADLELMRASHVNAIRTSHYPPVPYLLDLADEMGFWVVEEGDIETHGFVITEFRYNPSDDSAWHEAYVDRTARMVERDRKHPSVIVWSLGNEAGGGSSLRTASEWVKQTDPTRPVHYERDRSYAYSDLFSLMYTPHDRLDEIGRGIRRPDDPDTDGPTDKPVILCEYAHAMGAGPGGLTEYEELFERYPRLQGGFVWEWCDHTLTRTTPDGREFQAFGGDFGELVHDGAFAADGMVTSTRKPRPALADFAATVNPVRVRVTDSAATVTNGHDFLTLTGWSADWTYETATGACPLGSRVIGDVAPGSSAPVDAPAERPTAPGVLVCSLREPRGKVRAEGQLVVGWGRSEEPRPAPPTATFDRRGRLAGIGEVPVQGPWLGLWRAPTDNDHGWAMRDKQPSDETLWRKANLHALGHRSDQLREAETGLAVTWTSGPIGRDYGVTIQAAWFHVAGGARLRATARPYGEWNTSWARVGLDLVVPGLGGGTRVAWQGRGPGPGGPDTGQGNRWGWFESTVDGWWVDYARPQDNGVRADVRRLALTGESATGERRSLHITSPDPLLVSVRRWSDHEIDRATHPYELPDSDRLIVSLNAATHGYGTGACGPGVLPRHRLEPRAVTWDLTFTLG